MTSKYVSLLLKLNLSTVLIFEILQQLQNSVSNYTICSTHNSANAALSNKWPKTEYRTAICSNLR